MYNDDDVVMQRQRDSLPSLAIQELAEVKRRIMDPENCSPLMQRILQERMLELARSSAVGHDRNAFSAYVLKVVGNKLQRQWMVLHCNRLSLFKRPGSSNPKAHYDLNGYSVIVPDAADNAFEFHIKTSTGSPVMFAGLDAQSRDDWVHRIRVACRQAPSAGVFFPQAASTDWDDCLPLKIGIFMKQGAVLESWKRRTGVLFGGDSPRLIYYAIEFPVCNNDKLKAKGVIDLRQCNIVESIKECETEERCNLFAIMTPGRQFVMGARTLDEKFLWLQALRSVL